MIIITLFVLFELSVQTQAKYKNIFYSQINTTESSNSTLPIFDHPEVSIVECGHLCLSNQCCKEFLYSKTSQKCIGLHFPDFGNSVIPLVTSTYEGMVTYKKGCENGWIELKGHCYMKTQTKTTWADAKLECQEMCAYLVEIESKEESEWLGATFLDNVSCQADPFFDCTAWTAGNDLDAEGQYRWDHSNTSLSYTNWHPQEPSRLNPNEAHDRDCIDMMRDGLWNDRPCSYLNSVICEKSFKD